MVIANPMDHDDDVEHLFSWLQTPELRYREFAGAREITDTVITWRARAEAEAAAAENAGAVAEAPAATIATETGLASLSAPRTAPPSPPPYTPAVSAAPTSQPALPAREPTSIVPPSIKTAPQPPSPASFSLGTRGRAGSWRPQYEEPVVQPASPPPVIEAPDPPPQMPSASPPSVQPPPAPPMWPSAPTSGGLLGGAYREGGLNGHGATSAATAPASENQQRRGERSLDAVFGRLAGGRKPAADPRERIRHIRGLNLPSDRSR